jgi:hypothetical protein
MDLSAAGIPQDYPRTEETDASNDALHDPAGGS